MKFDSIESAVRHLREGKMVIVVDDEERENEGDLVIPAEKVDSAAINFMTRYGRGLICIGMTGERLDALKLAPMVTDNTSLGGSAFTVSVDAKKGTSTGISAHDRSLSIRTLINPRTKPEGLARPGHIFPLRSREGGVLVRAGHTEAAVDLARLAGCYPAGVLCEVMNEDGTMARFAELKKLAEAHNLKICTIAELIRYRRKTEKLIKRVLTTSLPTSYGNFRLFLYQSLIEGEYHVALVLNSPKETALVRVHSECLTGEVFHSRRCDCAEQLHRSLKAIQNEGSGIFLYMRQEGRGIGLLNKLRTYVLQDRGLDTVEANKQLGFEPDLRDYGIGAQILADLGVKNIKLLTNNPRKLIGLSGYGLRIVKRVPIEVSPCRTNRRYLKAKKEKLGHILKNLR